MMGQEIRQHSARDKRLNQQGSQGVKKRKVMFDDGKFMRARQSTRDENNVDVGKSIRRVLRGSLCSREMIKRPIRTGAKATCGKEVSGGLQIGRKLSSSTSTVF